MSGGDAGGRAAAARRWLLGGAFVFPPVTAALIIAGLSTLDGLFTTGLLVLLPAMGAAQAQMLDDLPLERMSVYASSAVTIAVLGGAALGLGLRLGGPEVLGLVPIAPGVLVVWAVGMTTAGVALVAGSLAVGRRLGRPESTAVAELMPRTARERAAFTGLSLVAGLGEELAYRGYLVAVLAPLVGPWGAVVAGAVPFSVLHGYQGFAGIVRTGLLGLLLGASLVVTGSLWPAVVAHAAVDVVLGAVLGEWLLARDRDPG